MCGDISGQTEAKCEPNSSQFYSIHAAKRVKCNDTMDGWMDGWMKGWRWMDGWVSFCRYMLSDYFFK